jgi:hypothetical protein
MEVYILVTRASVIVHRIIGVYKTRKLAEKAEAEYDKTYPVGIPAEILKYKVQED